LTNYIQLTQAIQRLKRRIQVLSSKTGSVDTASLFSEAGYDPASVGDHGHTPDDFLQLCHRFALTDIEKVVLVMAFAAEIDPDFLPLLSRLRPEQPYPTLALALSDRQQSTPTLTENTGLVCPNLIASDAVVWQHQGEGQYYNRFHLHPDLLKKRTECNLFDTIPSATPIQWLSDEEEATLCQTMADRPSHLSGVPQLIVLSESQWDMAWLHMAHIAKVERVPCVTIKLANLPLQHDELVALRIALTRKLTLSRALLLIDIRVMAQADEATVTIWQHWLEALIMPNQAQIWLAGSTQIQLPHLGVQAIAANLPNEAEQRAIWHKLNASLTATETEALVRQFNLSPRQIQRINAQYQLLYACTDQPRASEHLWPLCRQQQRRQLGALVKLIPPSSLSWQDIVLLPEQKKPLTSVIDHVQQCETVYQSWGFSPGKSGYGEGISILLSGSSGTGKTLAARILGAVLKRDIYQIDLSQVADKYIGEGEKKLARIFAEAQASGAILLFDEADALFGKRTKVTDSKDRNANLGVSYLLQQMEAYRGISILTTNYKSNLDDAFMRRIRFAVHFKFPDASYRQALWQQAFPANAPVYNLNFSKLARLPLAGGAIRNIVLQAAFMAAAQDKAIAMEHLLQACEQEYLKTDATLDPSLTQDWLTEEPDA
jgi:Pyruvate/2-oxoacid:ferredoxin oxidoreductase gamma subunit